MIWFTKPNYLVSLMLETSHCLGSNLSPCLGPCSTSLQSSLDPSSHQTLLHHWLTSRSSAMSGLDSPLIHQLKIQLRAPTACVAD
jgi:hypothetical protein